MKTYELTPEQRATLTPEEQTKYDYAISCCNDDWACGPYGGWVRGRDALKELGWTENRQEVGHRSFVTLENPTRFQIDIEVTMTPAMEYEIASLKQQVLDLRAKLRFYESLDHPHEILVDSEDQYLLEKYKWRVVKTKNKFYATRIFTQNNKEKHVLLHRLIMNFPDHMIDHINGNGLDNRKCNLRLATPSQNAVNRIFQNKSGYRGVSLAAKGKFHAKIRFMGDRHYLGVFETAEEAAKVYDMKALQLHGEFSVLNFPDKRSEYLKHIGIEV